MTNLTGQSFGRYHILDRLGEGGMATVYKAYDTHLEREVAVKVIRADQFGQAVLEQILARFAREARSLARLQHPNIVGVIDYGQQAAVPFLVMEYLPGGTLKQRMGKPLSYLEAAQMLLPVARALDYAHSEGIIHRDVKPSNILITRSGEPMLTDFGIAKLLDAGEGQTLTGTGVGIGTPEYMSPEQGMGHGVDARADVYSLGVVFYELVTGRKPFSADTPMAVIFKHVSDPLPRPRDLVPDLPESVERIIFKALAKQPENRYASMAAFAAALESLLQRFNKAQVQPVSRPAGVGPRTLTESRTASVSDLPAGTISRPARPTQTGSFSQPVSLSQTMTPVSTLPPQVSKDKKNRSMLLLLLLLGGMTVFGLAAIGGVYWFLNNLPPDSSSVLPAAASQAVPAADIGTPVAAPVENTATSLPEDTATFTLTPSPTSTTTPTPTETTTPESTVTPTPAPSFTQVPSPTLTVAPVSTINLAVDRYAAAFEQKDAGGRATILPLKPVSSCLGSMNRCLLNTQWAASSDAYAGLTAVNAIPYGNPALGENSGVVSAVLLEPVFQVRGLRQVKLTFWTKTNSNPRTARIHNCDSSLDVFYQLDGGEWTHKSALCGQYKTETSGWRENSLFFDVSGSSTLQFYFEYYLQNNPTADAGVYFLMDDLTVENGR